MGEKYAQSEVSTQLRKTQTIADLIKNVQFIAQIYKFGMLQCVQLGFCPYKGMMWPIASYMTDMPLATCNRLWRQFADLFKEDSTEKVILTDTL